LLVAGAAPTLCVCTGAGLSEEKALDAHVGKAQGRLAAGERGEAEGRAAQQAGGIMGQGLRQEQRALPSAGTPGFPGCACARACARAA
jgi:hypothetical protein